MKKSIFLSVSFVLVSLIGTTQETITAKEDIYVNKGTYLSNSTGNDLGNLILFGDGSNGGGWQSSIKWSGLDGFNYGESTGTRVNAEITIGNVGSYGKSDLIFKTKGTNNNATPTEKLRITSLGDVGIGTATPDSKLAVNGKIHAKEVKVDLTGWPDYVFENSYNLPSLQEVENHIVEEGHLPNIPSASEVEKNGIQLGEMNAKLLQKIEELTLYMIAQDKKTKQLQKEIELLKKKTK